MLHSAQHVKLRRGISNGRRAPAVLDPAAFVGPVEDANPSGPNLEYDAEFLDLERAQQGRPEQVIGSSVKAAEEPDWRDVAERAEALLHRTRDLRVVVALAGSLLRTQGFEGLTAALIVLKGLLVVQWDSVHPQLDADDDNDPTSRINCLLSLASHDGLLKALREIPVVQSKAMGRFSLRDIRIASGKQPAPAGLSEPPKQVQIDAAFRDADVETLASRAALIALAQDNVNAVDRLLIEKVGGQAPDLKPLMRDLNEIRNVLAEKLAARGMIIPNNAGGPNAGGPNDGSAAAGAQVAAAAGAVGEVSSREDVVLVLDRLCEYYRRHEPSSPVPLLLRRAKRLVSKDFLEIIRDMTPGGVAEAELLGGIEKASE